MATRMTSRSTEVGARQQLDPVHPGEVLAEEFLEPLGITQYRLAKETAVPPRRINEIVHGQRGITADTALRLARFFGTCEMFWLNLQARYDLDLQRARMGDELTSVQRFIPGRTASLSSQTARTSSTLSARKPLPVSHTRKVK
jgi:antitoxin HigA-1